MTTTTVNNATYVKHEIKIANTVYSVLVVTGAFNYVSICKITNNPWKMGKDFANFDEAVKHYKNPQMKTELLKIELGLA